MAFTILLIWSHKCPYLDKKVELERIHIATIDCVTPGRQLEAAVSHSSHAFNYAYLKI